MDNQIDMNRNKRRAKQGDTILIDYTAKLNNGNIVGSTKNKKPMKLTLGNDNINRALEVVIIGMTEGESQIVNLPANKAYGKYYDNLVFSIPKTKFKKKEPQLGDYYNIQKKSGQILEARVIAVNETKITLDGNHVLAGKDLTYEITVIEILN